MGNVSRNIEIELEHAKRILASIADVIEGDDDAKLDTVEGETGLLEAIDAGLARISSLKGHRTAIKDQIDRLKARSDRFDLIEERLRQHMIGALEAIHERKLERPLGTLSLRTTPAKVEIIDGSAIEEIYLHPPKPREPDKKAIREALEAGVPVSGAVLSNSGLTLAIRW